MSAARRLLGRLKLRHRLGAFRSALGLVTTPAAFAAREAVFYPMRMVPGLLGRVRPQATYTLRTGGRRVTIRHGSPDVYLLHEALGRGGYTPPRPAADALRAVGRPLRVVDLGANIGLFEIALAPHAPVARVVAYEPDPENLGLLRRNAAGGGGGAEWRIVAACAAGADGRTEFMAGRFAESRVPEGAAAGPTVSVPVRDVFPDLGDADLVKIDIEGGEWEILGDPRFADVPARAVVLEYHRWHCPGDDPRGAALSALRRAGYTPGEPDEDVDGFGVVWAWRAPDVGGEAA